MPRFTFVDVPLSKTSKQMEILLSKGKIRFRDRIYNLSDYRDKYDSMDEGDFYDFMEKIYEEDRAMSDRKIASDIRQHQLTPHGEWRETCDSAYDQMMGLESNESLRELIQESRKRDRQRRGKRRK